MPNLVPECRPARILQIRRLRWTADTRVCRWGQGTCQTGNSSQRAVPKRSIGSIVERRTKQGSAKALRKELVEEEIELRPNPDGFAGPVVDRDDGLDPNLEEAPFPDDSWIDRPGRPPASPAVESRLARQFHHGDHPVEECGDLRASHDALQVREAVFDHDTPFEHVRMPLSLRGDKARLCLLRAVTRWNLHAKQSGQRERSEEVERFREIAKALANEDRRGHNIKGLGSDCFPACSANLPVKAQGEDGLVTLARDDLVFQFHVEVIESRERRLPVGVEVNQGAAKAETQIRRQPLEERA